MPDIDPHLLCVIVQGDVRALVNDGFDSVKLDGCGKQTNMSLYAELQRQSGKTFETENCEPP
eukprot:COSAG02_NODE_4746_length_5031_cov_4.410787_6_plen_62_part_00